MSSFRTRMAAADTPEDIALRDRELVILAEARFAHAA